MKIKIITEHGKIDAEIDDSKNSKNLAYWPPGHAFCIFFGKTPTSTGEKPRIYSPGNVFAKVIDDVKILKKVKDGDKIRVERL